MTTKNTWTTSQNLLSAKKLYDACVFDCTMPKPEAESVEYAAHTFKINGKSVIYREAKITPTKTGQFVTIWKRNAEGITEPFMVSDTFDFIIIGTQKEDKMGQFVFPKSVLLQNGVISGDNKEGKRGIRVYPPWDVVANKQAEKTQKWQTKYFIQILQNGLTDLDLAKKLFSL
jgi:hypothetical protein